MTDDLCPLLEDYLLGELPEERRLRFERHFAECENCRTVGEQQAAADEAVKEAAESILSPAGLALRVGEGIERARRRRQFGIAVCCAVGVAAVALSIWSVARRDNRSTDPHDPGTIAEGEKPQENAIGPSPAPEPDAVTQRSPDKTVRIEFPSDVVALRVESGDPDVTLYEVFPIVGAHAGTP